MITEKKTLKIFERKILALTISCRKEFTIHYRNNDEDFLYSDETGIKFLLLQSYIFSPIDTHARNTVPKARRKNIMKEFFDF
ncbi:hypothetical protein MXB_809 [Myxobolus squamalis]|nr:hypothetical protein MXB_809 [Myxobolus squamalis]